MKQYKIYTKGNYIVIVDVQKNEYFYGIRKEVHIDKSNVNKAVYRAFNVKDFSSSIILAVPDILKENGTPYSEAEFDTFYQENTGNFKSGSEIDPQIQVQNETPIGIINGVNQNFVLANNPETNSIKLYFNGQRLKEYDDYVVSSNIITLNLPPISGDIIAVDYNY